MTFFVEVRLAAAYNAQNEPFSPILTGFRFFQIFGSCHSDFWKISKKKIINFHFGLGYPVFVLFSSEKSMMKLNVCLFKSEKLHYVMCTHQAHQVHQARIRHIFIEISMTGTNCSLDCHLGATQRDLPPGMSKKSPV